MAWSFFTALHSALKWHGTLQQRGAKQWHGTLQSRGTLQQCGTLQQHGALQWCNSKEKVLARNKMQLNKGVKDYK